MHAIRRNGIGGKRKEGYLLHAGDVVHVHEIEHARFIPKTWAIVKERLRECFTDSQSALGRRD